MKPFAIAEPCHEDWNAMRDDAGARHCGRCDKHVVDLAALTEVQVRGLLRLTGGKLCARQTVRGDALVLMPEPVKARSPFAWRMLVGGTIVASALGAAACQPAAAAGPIPLDAIVVAQVDPEPSRDREPTRPDVIVDEPHEHPMLGEIAAPPSPSDSVITFEAKSAKLTKSWAPAIAEIAAIIERSAWMPYILIEGHVARAEVGKSASALGMARARSVEAALIKQGVDGKRLRVVSRAFTQPVVPSAKEASLDALNSRVTFRICQDLASCK